MMKSRGAATAAFVLPVLLFAAVASSTFAADAPKRKAGLWEITQNIEGTPLGAMPPIQQCIDARTDDLMQQQGRSMAKTNCSQSDVKRDGNRVVVHTACKVGASTATSDGVFTGDFDSNYHADLKTKYSPPFQGIAELAMTIDAKWLGPCGADMKPGDISIGGMKFNPAQMLGQRPKPSAQ
jgi:hypothetical protein